MTMGPISAVNVELGIAEVIQAIDQIRRKSQEELQRQRDKALTELAEQLQITRAIIIKLEDLFVELLRGFRDPKITENHEALREHMNQTRILLESKRLLPDLEYARGVIEGATESPRFKTASYQEMVESLRELQGKLYRWRMALGPGGISGPGVWRLQQLCHLAENQLANASQPVDPEIAMTAKKAFDEYDWALSSDIHISIGQVKIHS